ncbi:cytidine deaminase [Streptococcus hyovaginalis]|uniref:cytidine deaminase n=1 Tax=Streptococcus hyovaginalis TaxID=149015 RepID=UPI000408C4DD|nr:cytidine deaminase [Streptococcus hyovaginalis]MDY3025088.1 cytidine deaminase [Streptococcus hyovaginalis]MDY4510331.1 cytidine deaminase [Streptococcus hyovaginalis]MDY5973302.1 cytidine deaminase [Streptococcus hyovaginalis]
METTDLVALAQQASENAYVPYSQFPIGAAVVTKSGEVFQGCNIENISFGLSNCGERTAIFKAVSEGHRELEKIAVYGSTNEPVSPCGACRQVMAEFFEPSAKVILISKNGKTVEMTVEELLPYSFTDLT